MSFDAVPPAAPAGHTTYDPTGRIASPAPSAPFARVYELEEARRRRDVPLSPIAGDRIPDEVWDEVDHAARLVEQMHTEGRRMMFDTDRLTGRVVASLLSPDGAVKPVSLREVVAPSAITHTGAGPGAA